MSGIPLPGEEFRDDLRLAAPPVSPAANKPRDGFAGPGARRLLSPAELAALTAMNDGRSLAALALTFGIIAFAVAWGVAAWPGPWVAAPVVVIGVQQHALFILAHESAHYRLFRSRLRNDAAGRAIGMATGISMCTYRVIHRLHHNNLYTEYDPDTAIHAGYPRGVAYLWKKLAQDLAGLNAWKTFAYFFGAPAIDARTNRAARPLDDTSPALRSRARGDRWAVLAFQAGAPLLVVTVWDTRALVLYLVLWLLPMLTVLQPILRLRAIAEHGAVGDVTSPLTAARSNRTSGSLGNLIGRALLFPHHVNYHLEHHLYPAVPHYRLPALHRLLQAKGALTGAEVRDVRDTMRLVFAERPPGTPQDQAGVRS